MSRSPRFRYTWCRGKVGHCRAGRISFAIRWSRLQRLISLSFRRMPFGSYSHFLAIDGGTVVVRENPTAEWLARQITEAFLRETATKYLIGDNANAFDGAFKAREDRPTSFHSPWQNGYVERLIGSVRRDCTDLDRVERGAPSTSRNIPSITRCERMFYSGRTYPAHARSSGSAILGGLHHRYVGAGIPRRADSG